VLDDKADAAFGLRCWRGSTSSASCRSCANGSTSSSTGGPVRTASAAPGRLLPVAAFATKAAELRGYDVAGLGRVQFNGT